jgi:alpha-1,2-mannosyltransferase
MATAAWIWSFALVVFTLIAARRAKDLPRIGQACVWIALLGLTALRSPFVPDDYGLFPALWLWTLVAATMATSAARIAVLAAAWCAFALVMPWAMAAPEQITLMLAVSTASQLLAIAIMFWAMLRRSSPKAQANVTPLSRVAGARQTVAI